MVLLQKHLLEQACMPAIGTGTDCQVLALAAMCESLMTHFQKVIQLVVFLIPVMNYL